MDNRFRPWRVLLFVVLCLGLLAFTYVLVFRIDFGGNSTVTVRFGAVGTIQPGSPVRQSGVKIGTVSRVGLASDDRRRVDVTLSLYRDQLLRSDDRISIVTGGLLGDQYIDVAAGDSGAPVVGPGDRLVGQSGLDLTALVDGGSGLVQDLRSTTRTIAGFLETHSATVDRILADAERGVHSAADAADRADRLLAKAEASWDPTAQDVRTALKNLKETSADLKSLVAGLAAPGAVAGMLSNPKTTQSASETLANLKAASESLKTVVGALEAALK